jgi:hypothetical protein
MKRLVLYSIFALALALPHARGQDDSLQDAAAPGPNDSPKDTAHYALKLLQAWDTAHPGPKSAADCARVARSYMIVEGPLITLSRTRLFTQQDVDTIAGQLIPFGIENLVVGSIAADKHYF